MERQSKTIFYNSLPRKRSAVGVLIFRNDRLLVLEPTYQSSWLVPGGVVNKFESPLEAAVRECKEEIGQEVEIIELLCVDYKRGNDDIGDAVHFLFLGKIPLDSEIIVDLKEIKKFLWMNPVDAISWLDIHLSMRVEMGFEAIRNKRTFYGEDGKIVI